MEQQIEQSVMRGHPCFGGNHGLNGRIHLPVAPRCTIQCRYCSRRHDCANESRPGVTSQILSPLAALQRVKEVMATEVGSRIKVVGIAGPGEPLANEETFETLRLVGAEFPHLIKCLSTNGLNLPQSLDRLQRVGLGSLTVTVNALDPLVGAKIYSWVKDGAELLVGWHGAELLTRRQLEGVRLAVEGGITVKVNTVLIPGINEDQIPLIAEKMKDLGAFVMNVMPVIPQGAFARLVPPSPEQLLAVRAANEKIIGQLYHCRQCRADAVGLIGD